MKISAIPLHMSKGYRSHRTVATIVCAVSFAWSIAEIDLKVINLGLIENVDVSGASIALLFFVGIGYLFGRCILEFSMQSLEVRRWRLAQLDFNLLLNVVRITMLMLAISGLSRSLNAVVYTVLFVGGVFLSFGLLVFLGVLLLAPIFAARAGGKSIASAVISALAWAELLSIGVLGVIYVSLVFASIHFEPLRSFWSIGPSPVALGLLIVGGLIVLGSFVVEGMLAEKLFAKPPPYSETRSADGQAHRQYHRMAQPIWDWSQTSTDRLRPLIVMKKRRGRSATTELPDD